MSVTPEADRAASQSVGFTGGTVTATASNGTKYALAIPRGALRRATKITLTPLRAITGLPVLKEAVAGVAFEPSGLAFARPARLTIEGAPAAPAGQRPIALTYEGEAKKLAVAFAARKDARIEVSVLHFSGLGVGFGTEEDLKALFASLTATPASVVRATDVLLSLAADPTNTQRAIDLLRRWFDDTILPAIVGATTDGELLTALVDFHYWMTDVPEVLGLRAVAERDLAAEIVKGREAFIPKLQRAVTENNDLCKQTHGLEPLANVLFWQSQAGALSIDTPANGLDTASVQAKLCAKLVLEGASLPQTMQVGFPHSLDFRLLLQFSDGTQQNVACAVALTPVNASVQHPVGNTDAFGHYTTVISATSSLGVEVTVDASVIMPGETTPSMISGRFLIKGPAGAGYDGTYVSWGGYYDGLSREAVKVVVTQVQNGISGTFESNVPGQSHSGRFSGTLGEGTLLNGSVTLTGCGGTFPLTSSQLVTRTDGSKLLQLAWSGTDCHGHTFGQVNVCGPKGLLTLDSPTSYQGTVIDYDGDGKTGVSGTLTTVGTKIRGSFSGEGGVVEFDGVLEPVSRSFKVTSISVGGCSVKTMSIGIIGTVTAGATVGVHIQADNPAICSFSSGGMTTVLNVWGGKPNICGVP